MFYNQFGVQGLGFRVYLGMQKPAVSRVRPYNEGAITYYFVGFGDAGSVSQFQLRFQVFCSRFSLHPSAQNMCLFSLVCLRSCLSAGLGSSPKP